MMLSASAPTGRAAIEKFLLEQLPSMGPPPRGGAGLARARRFFEMAGSPQDHARQVHVVGTAGKGAATAAIVARLVGAGATVGAHLSPHVYDLRERLLLNGELPSWTQVDDGLAELWSPVLQLNSSEGRPPSFFELTTALSWVIGRQGEVAYHATEAGIGGAFDATNTIDRTDKVTVIMPIGYDHMEILGEDLTSIAENKVAVIPAGGTVVVAPQEHRTAEDVISRACADKDARVINITAAPTWIEQSDAVAEAVLQELALADPKLDPAAPAADVHLPGRMERLDRADRHIILDGAHNPMKLRAVHATLDGPADVLVAALSQEKDLEACASELAELGRVVIATDFAVTAGNRVVRRSFSADELATAVKSQRPDCDVRAVSGIGDAVRAAVAATESGQTILATGSFMMLEPARDAASVAG